MTELRTETDDGAVIVEVENHEVYYKSNKTEDERQFVARVVVNAAAVTQSFIDAINVAQGEYVPFTLETANITYEMDTKERTMVDSTSRDQQTGESIQLLEIGLVAPTDLVQITVT